MASGARSLIELRGIARGRRCVFVAGLPGAGKSLLVRHLAALAALDGREVALLRWDAARLAFGTPAILARYPEVEGITHAGIRAATGWWARRAIERWHHERPPSALLVGETPLIGGRLVELARPEHDDAEPVLAGMKTVFVIAVPTPRLRRIIERARSRDHAFADGVPRTDANPVIVSAAWTELASTAMRLGLHDRASERYDPDLYAAVYEHVLHHRHALRLLVDEELAEPPELAGVNELVPGPVEVEAALAAVAARSDGELERDAARWYEVGS